MAEKGMLDLLDRLLGVVDKVDWGYDPNTDGYFIQLSPHLVEIRSIDRDQRHPYGLFVLDDEGEDVESVLSSEDDLPSDYVAKLAQLYVEAKRAEKNLDGVLKDIIGKLPEE
jgi:hypothetical protein